MGRASHLFDVYSVHGIPIKFGVGYDAKWGVLLGE